MLSRALLVVAAAAAGAVAGVVGSFLHPLTVVGVPAGLLLGLGLTLAAVAGAGLAAGSRAAAAVAAVGWLVPVLVLSSRRPEGDLVVTGSALGYAWLLAGLVAAAAGLAPAYRRTGPEADEGRTSPVPRPSADGDARR